MYSSNPSMLDVSPGGGLSEMTKKPRFKISGGGKMSAIGARSQEEAR
jgi:hypothetical protein